MDKLRNAEILRTLDALKVDIDRTRDITYENLAPYNRILQKLDEILNTFTQERNLLDIWQIKKVRS
jgi:hypothetical protein